MPEELWTEVPDIVQKAVIKTIPKKKKCKKAKWLSEEALQIAEKRREAKGKGEKERYTQEGLSEDPLTNPEEMWYTDGSSFVLNGKRRARYAEVPKFETIEAKPLPSGTSARLAELIALTQALELGKGKKNSHLH